MSDRLELSYYSSNDSRIVETSKIKPVRVYGFIDGKHTPYLPF